MRRKKMITVIAILFSCRAFADCQIVDGDKKTPYNGGSLVGIEVEKKSLAILNREYPNLRVVESIFKGEVRTCTACTEKHLTCSRP